MEKSKTSMELFKELYPPKETADNPLTMAEAIGYLNCLVQFVPSVKEEADEIKLALYCGISLMMV